MSAVVEGHVPEWSFADRLRKAREYAGLDQGALSSELGLGRNTISRAETGQTAPKAQTVISWAAVTGVSSEWLLSGDKATEQQKKAWVPAPNAVDDVTGRMQAAVGTVTASDEAIRRVLSLETVAEMKADERFLAWMLVTASDADPERVGLNDEDVPAFFDADQLRDALCLHGGSNPGPKD